MTRLELYKLSKRIDEIDAAIDLCADNDGDVMDNLYAELEQIESALIKSMNETTKPKLKLVV